MKWIVALALLILSVPSLCQKEIKPSESRKLIRLGQSHVGTNWDSVRFYFAKGLQVAQEAGDPEDIAWAHIYTAMAHGLENVFDSAMVHLEIAEGIAEENDLKKPLSSVYGQFAGLNVSLGKYDEARRYYRQQVEILWELEDTVAAAYNMGGIAMSYARAGELDNALVEVTTGLSYIDQTGMAESFEASYLVGLKATLLSDLGELDSALVYFERALVLQKKNQNHGSLPETYLNLGNLYKDKGDLNRAAEYMEEAVTIMLQIDFNKDVMESAYESLSDVYEELGQFDKALDRYRQSIRWKDSLKSDRNQQIVEELEVEYKTKEKEQENLLLKKDADLKQARLDKLAQADLVRRNYTILGAVLAILVLAFVLYQLRQKQKNNRVLSEKNEVITSALRERETLIREVHHRVKNNFQLVSSILQIQAGSISDDEVKRLILDSRDKIQSMAMIHKRLYGESNINEIDTKMYFEDLITELESSYGASVDEEVSVKSEIQRVGLNVDQTLACGIIITELLSNIFKHAFPDASLEKQVDIKLYEAQDQVVLQLSDNGRGFNPDTQKSGSSFGLKLIDLLSKNLGARLTISGEQGTVVNVEIPVANG